jgi:drug/metabolite transporter (DMT)-like permease
MLVVLLAALLHASWNALLKSGRNKMVETALLCGAAGALALPVLPWLPLPAPASWGWLGASVVLHCAYFLLVAAAYRRGDMSLAYPLMRGCAPLLAAVVAALALAEAPSAAGWGGIVLLCAGVALLAIGHRRAVRGPVPVLAICAANAVLIAAYTVVDALGARASGDPWSYVLWLWLLNAFPMLALALAADRAALRAGIAASWLRAGASGLCLIASYGMVLWAMTRAPIALVAALRETSVVFGTALAALFLRERFGRARWIAVGLIAAGAAAIRAA